MKKHLSFPLIIGFALTFLNNATLVKSSYDYFNSKQKGPMEAYAGKYQLHRHGVMAFLGVSVVDSALVFTQLWDGKKMPLKHLSGDNFIVDGLDWSVQFVRGTDKKITEVVVKGDDHWIKVKS